MQLEENSRELVQEFHQNMVGIYEAASIECDYNAARFVALVHEHGGQEAAKRLLMSKELPQGLVRLWELGRLDISMEALVTQKKWALLFTTEELETARKRLSDLGYL